MDDRTQTQIEQADRRLHAREIVVVIDDDDRENEAISSSRARSARRKKMAFIIRHNLGIVCAPLSLRTSAAPYTSTRWSPPTTRRSAPPHRVGRRQARSHTGISGEERCNTVARSPTQTWARPDFVRPGTSFADRARGARMMRSGHTEACVDLCRLAGLPPAGRCSPNSWNDGRNRQARRRSRRLREAAQARAGLDRRPHAWRRRVRSSSSACHLSGEERIGELSGYAFVTPFDAVHHMAFCLRQDRDGKNILSPAASRLNVVSDVCGDGKSNPSLARPFKARRAGVLVYLRDAPPVCGDGGRTANRLLDGAARERQWREIGARGANPRDLGISSIRLLASRERTYVGLSGFGIEIVATETLDNLNQLPVSAMVVPRSVGSFATGATGALFMVRSVVRIFAAGRHRPRTHRHRAFAARTSARGSMSNS